MCLMYGPMRWMTCSARTNNSTQVTFFRDQGLWKSNILTSVICTMSRLGVHSMPYSAASHTLSIVMFG